MTAPSGAEGRVELARARAGMFGLLARVFGSLPSAELVAAMKDRQMQESLAGFGVAFEEDFTAGDEQQRVRELAQEYTRLFRGPGKHITAYESVYVRGEGELEPRLWGKATAEVAKFYRELGIELPEGRTPDHLSLELETMAIMAQAQGDRLEAGDEDGAGLYARMQERFCKEHLLQWVPAVCGDVQRYSSSSFYRGMAALTVSLVELACGEEEEETHRQ